VLRTEWLCAVSSLASNRLELIALWHQVIEDAERQGLLHPHTGSRIFEGTVGSTGISIATIAKARQVHMSWVLESADLKNMMS
jgi:cysteine synthase